MTAFQAAWAAITHTPVPPDRPARHLRDALVTAVRIGDDTDTVAAIAGMLLGAHWGAPAIPTEWTAILHGDTRPGWLARDARDLERLVVAILGTGLC